MMSEIGCSIIKEGTTETLVATSRQLSKLSNGCMGFIMPVFLRLVFHHLPLRAFSDIILKFQCQGHTVYQGYPVYLWTVTLWSTTTILIVKIYSLFPQNHVLPHLTPPNLVENVCIILLHVLIVYVFNFLSKCF